MTDAAAFQASYADWKLIKTRKVVQIVLEIPVEKADEAYKVLGGMPNHGKEIWLAIARLNAGSSNGRTADFESANDGSSPSPAAKRFHELPVGQQAAMRCKEKAFWEYLGANDEPMAKDILLRTFGVSSRRDIPQNAWAEMNTQYGMWCVASAIE